MSIETRPDASQAATDPKATLRAAWASGDYHRFAKATIWGRGAELVEACGIKPGQQVLDVAAGSGNAAIRAAEAGADVIASDLTPENFDAGRREARARGVELEWVEADAEDLPFEDGSFDVVISVFGAMFAPDHEATADEMLRVCRPGGTIGMFNFTPEGLISDFFDALAAYAPPPPGDPPPQWGQEEHVRKLFGDRVDELKMDRRQYSEWTASPAEYAELVKATFGPVTAIFGSLADSPERSSAAADLLAFAERANSGAPGGAAEYRYEYLSVLARRS